jgi:hypothetical protein
MGKPLQIRDVPDEILDTLRQKATQAGMRLSAYALEVLTRDALQPSMADVLGEVTARLAAAHGPKIGAEHIAELVRADRGPLSDPL